MISLLDLYMILPVAEGLPVLVGNEPAIVVNPNGATFGTIATTRGDSSPMTTYLDLSRSQGRDWVIRVLGYTCYWMSDMVSNLSAALSMQLIEATLRRRIAGLPDVVGLCGPWQDIGSAGCYTGLHREERRTIAKGFQGSEVHTALIWDGRTRLAAWKKEGVKTKAAVDESLLEAGYALYNSATSFVYRTTKQ